MNIGKIDFMRIARAALVAVSMIAAAACTKYTDIEFTEIENRSLRAWMTNHHPELLGNFQENGAYYVEVLAAGNPDSIALKDVLVESDSSDDSDDDTEEPSCWVSLNITGRNLEGQVCVTREELMARMQGSFTKYTHYVPYRSYLGIASSSMVEGSYLAMKNTLTLSAEYAASNGLGSTEFEVRHGTKLRLYLPSTITAGTGLTGDGGYEGEYSLDGNKPVIMEVEVMDRINNPLSYEAYMVDGFGIFYGGISPLKEVVDDDEDGGDDSSDDEEDDDDDEEEEDDGLYWRHACDTIQGLIVTKRYSPGELKFNYDFPFTVDADEETGEVGKTVVNKSYKDTDVYSDLSSLEDKINEVLVERFGEGSFDGKKVGLDGTAKIWYITRFMDGFILDTNIDEVRELIFGYESDSREVLSFSPESDKDDIVTAWYYTVPHMRHGGWYTVVTTSTFAYGYSGQNGSSSTTSSGMSYYYNPYLMYNGYMNSMYGSSYYDLYYYNMYNSMYNSSLYSDTTSESTTTIYTEVQPYTPLIFQLYLEESDD